MKFIIRPHIMIYSLLLIIPVLAVMCSSQAEEFRLDHLINFDPDPVHMGKVEFDDINEASGLAASRINKNMLWTHNDSGDDSRIFLMTDSGKHVGEFFLRGIEIRDAEDMAVGPGPEENLTYIYLGDIGDNWANTDVKQIYRFPEPDVSERRWPIKDTIDHYDVINFRFPDRMHDAETLLIDPATKDIYIATKREINILLYKLPFRYQPGDTTTLEMIGSLPLTIIVGGDISPAGNEILLKSYSEIYYYRLEEGEKIENIVHKKPELLPYAIEPQGEAIAWNVDASGYFTLSEEVFFIPAALYFYRRNKP